MKQEKITMPADLLSPPLIEIAADLHAKRVSRCMKPSLLSVLCAAFLLSQAHAQGLLQTHRISADLANQAVAAVVAKCASQGYAVTAALVDADGVQQAVLRGNGAGASTLNSAYSKASANFKTDTTAVVERSKTAPLLANLFKLPHLLLLSGASLSRWATRWSERSALPGRRAAISTTPAPTPASTRSRSS
jgi:uncharacterized protein GlcG (DUF336 family)